MDYSFLKLYDTLSESISDDLFKTSQINYYTMIQLSPLETYLQMTNYDGDFSLDSDFTCEIIDGCENVLYDITSNVFVEEYIDSEGLNQAKIEYVNLGVDYGGRAVHIRFSVNSSNKKYYTRPVKISQANILKTYRFDYSNPTNLQGLSYESANVYQSIRLLLRFKGFSNETEVSEYNQISTGNKISLRPIRQIARNFITENIDSFTFVRLQEMLLHNEIYLDGIRLTNKPILEYDDRLGESNIFRSTFTANVNEKDKYTFNYQVFDGLQLSMYQPLGTYITGTSFTVLSFDANVPITINTGDIYVKKVSDNSLVQTYTQDDMGISGGNQLKINTLLALPDDQYYVTISAGLVTGLGIDNEAVTDNTTWAFELRQADYSGDDYFDKDYFT